MMPPIMSGPEFWSTSMLDSTGLLHQGQQPASLQGPATTFSLSFHHHCTSSSSQSSSSSSHASAYSSLVSETSQDPSHEFPTVSSSTSISSRVGSSRRAKKSSRIKRKKSKSNKRRSKPSKVIDQEEFGEFEEEDEDEDHDDDEYGDEDDEAGYQDGYRQPQQRHAANLRERRRMQSINEAFEGLRERIPTLPYEKRLSKVDTLRLAIGYINFLGELVRTGASSLNPNGTSAFPSQRYCCPPPPKKVLVKSHLVGPNGTDLDSTHSLSWESDENRRPGSVCHSNHTLVAKVWTPEDPRGPAHVTVSNNNSSSNNNNNSVTALSNSDQNQQQSAMFQHVSAY